MNDQLIVLPNLPENLPVAQLPEAYEHAKVALAECVRMDECKDWADKMAALSSYAKQAQDEELWLMAKRIQARASRRCGELLLAMEANKGGRPPERTSGVDPTSFTRTQAAREAGLSKDQQMTAVRLARVPKDEFEAQVESDDPPTITELADQGRRKTPVEEIMGDRTPTQYTAAGELIGLIKHVIKCGEPINLSNAIAGLSPRELDTIQTEIVRAQKWLDKVMEMLNVQ